MTSDIPEGLGLGLGLFTVIAGDPHSGIVCTLCKFVDGTELCDTVNKLEGRDAMQRDLDRTDVACVNLMKFNRAKCQILQLGHGSSKHKYRMGGEWIENSPAKKNLRVLVHDQNHWSAHQRLTDLRKSPPPPMLWYL